MPIGRGHAAGDRARDLRILRPVAVLRVDLRGDRRGRLVAVVVGVRERRGVHAEVGVRVDQPRGHELAGAVDHPRPGGDGDAGVGAERGDRAAGQHDRAALEDLAVRGHDRRVADRDRGRAGVVQRGGAVPGRPLAARRCVRGRIDPGVGDVECRRLRLGRPGGRRGAGREPEQGEYRHPHAPGDTGPEPAQPTAGSDNRSRELRMGGASCGVSPRYRFTRSSSRYASRRSSRWSSRFFVCAV